MFTHLHLHSHFSFLSSTIDIPGLIKATIHKGMDSVALTDTNGMYGVIQFYKLAKENGIKPIIGAEIDDPAHRNIKAVLLAKNRAGYSEICRLVTERQLKEEFHLTESLKRAKEVVILSESPHLLRSLASELEQGSLYCELTHHGDRESRLKCRGLLELSRELGLPAAATGDVHFFHPEEYHVYRILRAIEGNTTISNLNSDALAHRHSYLKSPREMEALFREFPEAVVNTRVIKEQCNVELDLGVYKFPGFSVSEEETQASYLRKIAFKGLRERYQTLTGRAVERLEYELKVVEALGFSGYFLVVWDITQRAKGLGIPFIGRGSAANSMLSYCLGFTAVDPLRYDLYFERFLNPERKSPPDIDLDFPWNERDRILNYVYEKYGEDRVAMICTTNRFAARSAIREVGKAMGLSEAEVNEFTSRIPYARAGDLTNLREKYVECRHLQTESEPLRTVLSIGQRIAEFPRHLSIHCGGIVITPSPITDYTPLERSSKGLVITQYDMFPIEDLGLVKIDLLGNRSLAVLMDTVESATINTGSPPDVYQFPVLFEDRNVRELIRSGRTMGCFYIESPAMRSLLRKLKVETFEMLTAASSVIRPGVAESGMMNEFIERHLDPSKVTYLHPKLEELLRETYGVMVYQEDVIKVAHHLAGMSLGEADLLRRAMSGKMRSREAMARLESRFVASCAERGVDKTIAREVWRQIASFAGYAFCKAHSASFAMLSFQMAYLKHYFPAEFMAAVISNMGGFYGTSAYIQEARRMELIILPPCVNRSELKYTGRGNQVRVGLMQVKGLTVSSMKSIVQAREKGWYKSLSDLIVRTTVGYEELRSLIRVGACNCFGKSRPELLWMLDMSYTRLRSDSSLSLFREDIALKIPEVEDYSALEKCRIESELLGFPLTRHPLEIYHDEIVQWHPVPAERMMSYVDRRVTMAGWLIAAKRVRCRKSGNYMKFMSMEDLTGTYEVTLFPRVYSRYGHLTVDRGPYVFEGKVQDDFGACSLIADKVKVFENGFLAETNLWR